jgi:hypothetical protein
MLNRAAFFRCFKTSFNLSKLNLYGSFYSFNIKNLSKKDKGRLSDSETKRGAKAFTSDNSETVSYESKSSSNVKQIQTVSGHIVFIHSFILATNQRRHYCWKICCYLIYRSKQRK